MSLNNVTWTNGKVALCCDLIFGVCVFGEREDKQQWIPLSSLSLDDLKLVERAVDHNPGCPYKQELAEAVQKAEREAAEAWGK